MTRSEKFILRFRFNRSSVRSRSMVLFLTEFETEKGMQRMDKWKQDTAMQELTTTHKMEVKKKYWLDIRKKNWNTDINRYELSS